MKNKIVVWGTNAAEEKILIALELQTEASKVMLYTFPESIATEEFVAKMMNDWREDKPVDFPEGYTSIERELSVTDSLLPDDIKATERSEVIQRAQTEWHFVVLSTKLHQAYQQELAEFKEKIEQLSAYDNKLWDSLKAFWDKVQKQSRERNLFRKHADNLRDNINVLFEDLKGMKARVQNEFMSASSTVAEEFNKALDEVEERIAAGGAKLNTAFEDLKKLQSRYRNARMSNEHRNQIWDRLDGAFKKAKERKFGPAANEGSLTERHERRLSGLADAVKRMEDSITRDEEELNFQKKKINSSDGQLEAQIRMAKIKMIEERVVSKKEKLEEIKRTMADIERQAGAAKAKEVKRAEKEAEKQRITEAKEAIRSEIAEGIKSKTGRPEEKEESLFEAAATVLGDVLLDALDTAKAVASVVAEKAEEAIDKAADKGEGALGKAKAVAGVMAEKAEEAFELALDKAEEAIEAMKSKDSAPAAEEKATADGIIVEDVVHKSEEKPAEESVAAADGIIIEDVVHKSAADAPASLESTAAADGIIIEDVVHPPAAIADAGSSEEEEPAKAKKTSKKKEA